MQYREIGWVKKSSREPSDPGYTKAGVFEGSVWSVTVSFIYQRYNWQPCPSCKVVSRPHSALVHWWKFSKLGNSN